MSRRSQLVCAYSYFKLLSYSRIANHGTEPATEALQGQGPQEDWGLGFDTESFEVVGWRGHTLQITGL